MTIYPILIAPDSRLKLKSQPVELVDDDLRQFMDDMLETMYSARGIGLAAPQIAVQKRVIVIDVAHVNEKPKPLRMANPEIIDKHDTKVI